MSPQQLPDDVPWSLLGRHFAGELPPAESDALRRWIEASPAHAELMEQLRRLWADAPRSDQPWDVDAAIRRVMQPPAAPARVIPLPAFYREPQRPAWVRAVRRAAGIAAAVGLVAGGVWTVTRRSSDETAFATIASEMRTRRGQRMAFRLPDGSEVVLGPASRMRYVIARDRGPRAVELEGEAYFTVTHDVSRPFTVRTAYAVATDLGTRFNVRAYVGDSVVEVAVQEGKVALAPAQATPADAPAADQVVLAARDLGVVTAGGRVRAERGIDVATRLAWTESRLEFRAVPLRDVVAQLSRWYDLDIRLGDSASARRQVTATFRHESAVDALRLIAATLELRLELRGGGATLWTH